MKKINLIISASFIAIITILSVFLIFEASKIKSLSDENRSISEELEEQKESYSNLSELYEASLSRFENIDSEELITNEIVAQYAIANETLVELLEEKDNEIANRDLVIQNKQDIIDGKQNAIDELQDTVDELNDIIEKDTGLLNILVSRFTDIIGTNYVDFFQTRIDALEQTKDDINENLTNTEEIQKYLSEIDEAEVKIQSLADHYPDCEPLEGGTITSKYGLRTSTVNGKTVTSFHNGLDVSYSPRLDVVSAAAGTVIEANTVDNGGLGLYIIIDHGNGYQTVYGHLSQVDVKVGQTVKKGQYIGLMGESGVARGIHLHIEVFFNGERQDPLDYFDYN